MKRILIFTALFPPLVLFVYVAADPVLRRDLPGLDFLTWLIGFAYMIATIPAWLTAGVDWALAKQPIYLRLPATMTVGALLAELVAYSFGQPYVDFTTAMVGAIPAAVCSLIAALADNRKFTTGPTRGNRLSA